MGDARAVTMKQGKKKAKRKGDQLTRTAKKDKKLFIYGNYSTYYGYRKEKGKPDPRVRLLQPYIPKNKACLDIGCNIGVLSCEIGVDIDETLIATANHIREDRIQQYSSVLAKQHSNDAEKREEISRKIKALQAVSFRAENYVQSPPTNENFDTVLCLSVTKWIHLNWGDDAIITLFKKIYDSLNPGGTLILEPQPWKSYKKKHTLTQTIKDNYKSIKLKPEDFPRILQQEIGFCKVEPISQAKSMEGFDRPMYKCTKPLLPALTKGPSIDNVSVITQTITTQTATITETQTITQTITTPTVATPETLTTTPTFSLLSTPTEKSTMDPSHASISSTDKNTEGLPQEMDKK